MRVLLVGMSHRTAPLEVRERFAAAEPRTPLAKLAQSDEIDEAVLISTCNRIEVIALSRTPEAARHRLQLFFRRELAGGEVPPSLSSHLYEHTGAAAVRHLLRVASAIDSMVVGEPQILGQVKEAYRLAVECNASGAILNRLFSRAFATAKRVRRETGIAERPVSVARVAVDLARQIFESFADKHALLVGAGEMIELALDALRGDGLAAVRVANRTTAHAEALAGRVGGSAHGLDELPALLERSDVVLSCIGGSRPILGRDLVARAVRARRGRPMFMIDIGVPRNVDAAVNDLDDVYLYDLDDLQGVAAENAEARRRETERAEAIVRAEQQRFEGWLAALEVVPTIRHLRARGEAVRMRELERWQNRLALSDEQQRGVEALTRAIVNKILHPPVSRLRAESEREEGIAYLEAARALFALDDPKAPGAEIDAELDFYERTGAAGGHGETDPELASDAEESQPPEPPEPPDRA